MVSDIPVGDGKIDILFYIAFERDNMLVTTKDDEGCRERDLIGVPPSLCREKGWGRRDLYYDESMEGLLVLAALEGAAKL